VTAEVCPDMLRSHSRRPRACLAIVCVAALAGTAAHADQVRWGAYDIYFTTFRSNLIPAEVAQAHQIIRSRSRIVTNITIRRDDQPVRAAVSGETTNLLGQVLALQFAEVREETAVYYLASQVVDEKDLLRYEVAIRPEDQTDIYTLQFKREYIMGDAE
jgi:hypothetical protein